MTAEPGRTFPTAGDAPGATAVGSATAIQASASETGGGRRRAVGRTAAAASITLLAVGLAQRCASAPVPVRPSRQTEEVFRGPDGSMPYLLYKPDEYETASRPWPVLLFLHGGGERGSDLALVKREGLPRLLEHLDRFPFLVVSPQCPTGRPWSTAALEALLDDVLTRYRADPRRVSVTGLSSGGVAALEIATARPERFAAAAVVAPSRWPRDLCRMKSVPLWIFHNSGDERVAVRQSQKLVEAFEACGGRARLTIFEADGHDAWTDAYMRQELYDWLLSRTLPAP